MTHTQQRVCHALSAKGGRFDPNGEDFVVINPHRTLEKDGSVSEGFKVDDIVDALHGPSGNKEPLICGALGCSLGGADDNAAAAAAAAQLVCQPYSLFSHSGCAKKRGGKATKVANAGGAFTQGQGGTVIAFHERKRGSGREIEPQEDLAFCLESGTHNHGGGRHQNIAERQGVRVLMPVERLRLQGFPDDWLDLAGLSDSKKYEMTGNAVSVPVAEWIARRIRMACPDLRTYLSLFTGIGGVDLGFDRAGLGCIGQAESSKHCMRVLEQHWPKVPRYDDVETFSVSPKRS